MSKVRLTTDFEAWPGPYIQILPQHIPSPTLMFTFGRRWHRIALSEKLQQHSFDREIQRVCRRFRKHRNQFNPRSWQYGKGFVYHRSPQETLVFDTQCRLIEVSKVSTPRVSSYFEVGEDDD